MRRASSHQRRHLLVRLHAVHGLLHVGIEVLHAEADAVEAQLGQHLQPPARRRCAGRSRSSTRRRARARSCGAASPSARAVPRRTGRSACRRPGAAGSPAGPGPAPRCAVPPRGSGSAGRCAARFLLPGDDLVAGAVVAQRFAERDVHVQRQRRRQGGRAVAALRQRLAVVRRRRRPRRSGRPWGRRCSAARACRTGAAARGRSERSWSFPARADCARREGRPA